MNFFQWAQKWGIPAEAVADYAIQLGTDDQARVIEVAGESEAAVQTRVRLKATKVGARLYRNNVGATYTEEGAFLRYGLANDSKQMNTRIKSSDLIGIRPVQITHSHVGTTIGQFVALEVKAADWKYSGRGREAAQLKFLEIVQGLGGHAAFATGADAI